MLIFRLMKRMPDKMERRLVTFVHVFRDIVWNAPLRGARGG